MSTTCFDSLKHVPTETIKLLFSMCKSNHSPCYSSCFWIMSSYSTRLYNICRTCTPNLFSNIYKVLKLSFDLVKSSAWCLPSSYYLLASIQYSDQLKSSPFKHKICMHVRHHNYPGHIQFPRFPKGYFAFQNHTNSVIGQIPWCIWTLSVLQPSILYSSNQSLFDTEFLPPQVSERPYLKQARRARTKPTMSPHLSSPLDCVETIAITAWSLPSPPLHAIYRFQRPARLNTGLHSRHI